ncbi:hypothetical protein GCM10008020_29430 [Massilia psychrophila]|nr:hypothetical protein GCM10008020_29430 [Massilia psychrophila]
MASPSTLAAQEADQAFTENLALAVGVKPGAFDGGQTGPCEGDRRG